jgi:uncharacterized caspase-like protein
VKELYLYRDYHALVIGIGNYDHWPKLPNAANDAREVAAKLTGQGFQVKTVIDPTSSELRKTFNQLVYQTGRVEDRAILLYFAGHGETETLADDTRMGFIIPRECPLMSKDPIGFSACAISMRDIESLSMRIKSRHVIMLFDSCFSGSLFNIVRAVPYDITEKAALPVRQYITAGSEDEQVPDRSMFKRVLLNGLEGDADLTNDGYITGSELGMYLSDKVVNYTRRAQHPQYGKINNPSLDRGDFVFVPLASSSVARDASPTRPQEKPQASAVRASAPAAVVPAERPPEPAKQEAPPRKTEAPTQARLTPASPAPSPSDQLAAMTAPSFPPAGTRYAYRIQKLKESRTEKYVVLGEGTYEGRKVHQVKIEEKDGLVLYDLKTGNWMCTVVDGSTVGNAKPYEDIFRYPLEVGNKHQVEFYYFDHIMSGNTRASVEVVSFEEVRVAAGTFTAYQILAEELPGISYGQTSAFNPSTFVSANRLKRIWYSPELKIVIKMEDSDGRNGITTRTELLEYSKP